MARNIARNSSYTKGHSESSSTQSLIHRSSRKFRAAACLMAIGIMYPGFVRLELCESNLSSCTVSLCRANAARGLDGWQIPKIMPRNALIHYIGRSSNTDTAGFNRIKYIWNYFIKKIINLTRKTRDWATVLLQLIPPRTFGLFIAYFQQSPPGQTEDAIDSRLAIIRELLSRLFNLTAQIIDSFIFQINAIHDLFWNFLSSFWFIQAYKFIKEQLHEVVFFVFIMMIIVGTKQLLWKRMLEY